MDEARASSILKGLGFEQDRQNAPTPQLSGGRRLRVALATVRVSQPDLPRLEQPRRSRERECTLSLEEATATDTCTASSSHPPTHPTQ
ncbi:hypothetical protein VE26_00180, partial [Devosia chinhatensis]